MTRFELQQNVKYYIGSSSPSDPRERCLKAYIEVGRATSQQLRNYNNGYRPGVNKKHHECHRPKNGKYAATPREYLSQFRVCSLQFYEYTSNVMPGRHVIHESSTVQEMQVRERW